MCEHEHFTAQVEVTRLTKVLGEEAVGYSADVRIWCKDCGLAFQFLGLPPGYSPIQASCSVFGTEARLPIASGDWELGAREKECPE